MVAKPPAGVQCRQPAGRDRRLGLIANLPAVPAKPCDAPNFLVPGLPVSFATMDLILATVCAVALGAYLSRNRAR